MGNQFQEKPATSTGHTCIPNNLKLQEVLENNRLENKEWWGFGEKKLRN